MNWYKLAFPIARCCCPKCDTDLLIDVKQRTDTLKSDPYKSVENGTAITKCAACGTFLSINYTWQSGQFFAQGSLQILPSDQVVNRLESGQMLVQCGISN